MPIVVFLVVLLFSFALGAGGFSFIMAVAAGFLAKTYMDMLGHVSKMNERMGLLERQVLWLKDALDRQNGTISADEVVSPDVEKQVIVENITEHISEIQADGGEDIIVEHRQDKQLEQSNIGNKPGFFTRLLSGNILAKAGALLMFFAAASLLKLGFDRGLFSPDVRTIGIGALGIVLATFGFLRRHETSEAGRNFSWALQGGGAGLLYLVIYFATFRHGWISASSAMALWTILSGGFIASAVIQRSQPMACLAVVGALLSPVLSGIQSASPIGLLTYLFIMNVAVLVMTTQRDWKYLVNLTWVGTWVLGLSWAVSHHLEPADTLLYGVIGAWLFYMMSGLAYRSKDSGAAWNMPTLIWLTPMLAMGAITKLTTDNVSAFNALCFSLLYGAGFIFDRTTHWTRQARGAISIVLMAIAAPLYFGESWTATVWGVEFAVLAGWLINKEAEKWKVSIAMMGFCGSIVALILASGHHDVSINAGIHLLAAIGIQIAAKNRLGVQRWPLQIISMALLSFFATKIFTGYEIGWQACYVMLVTGIGAMVTTLINLYGKQTKDEMFAAWSWYLAVLFVNWMAIDHRLSATPLLLSMAAFLANLLWVMSLPAFRENKNIGRIAAAFFCFAELVAVHILAISNRGELSPDFYFMVVGAPVLVGGVLAFAGPVRQNIEATYWLIRGSMVGAIGWLLATMIYQAYEAYRHIPVLNLIDMAVISVFVALFWLSRSVGSKLRTGLLSVAFFAVLNGVIARAVSVVDHVPYLLSELWFNSIFQTLLSVSWTAVFIIMMVFSVRRSLPSIWRMGLVGLVVIGGKLIVVDMANKGTLAWTITLVCVATMLLVAGRFAPQPPQSSEIS